ncbi:MAG: polysaccharide deacetylase family protein [Gammaproteobacteria bacterium]|nr:polysaccharide deacetylase family protein [Gammaproteobacteria bacterium]
MTATSVRPTRWVAKKTARYGVAAGSLVRHLRNTAPGIRVLTYHDFGDSVRDPFCVSPQVLERQMAYLANRDIAISLSELNEHVYGHRVVRDGAVVVTVDDGLRSFYTHALPIFREYGIPAVAFVSSGLVNGSGESNGPNQAAGLYMTWEQIGRARDAGMTIGSHAVSHRSLARLPLAEARDEIFESRHQIEQALGEAPACLAYPFGTAADFNEETASLIRSAGYSSAFTSQHGSIRAGGDAYFLPRIKVEGGENMWMFRQLISGGLDAWGILDRLLWRVQASASA